MREGEVRNFFAANPGIDHKSVISVGKRVSAGLELGELRYVRGSSLRVVKQIARTLIYNSALLGIEIPAVGYDKGFQFNAAGEEEHHFAHLGFVGNHLGIIYSDKYLHALIRPDRFGRDLHLRQEGIESVTAHECFHLKQMMDYPWKSIQDAIRSNTDSSSWDVSRTEKAAQIYARVYEQERTRIARERNTALFLADMGIDPTGILDPIQQVAARASKPK